MTKSFPLINLYQFTFSSNQQIQHNRSINFRTKLQTNIIGMENKPYASQFIKQKWFLWIWKLLAWKLIERLCWICWLEENVDWYKLITGNDSVI